MRTRTVVLLIALIAVSTIVRADGVTVEAPMIKVVHSNQRLRDVCPPEGEYDACTRFIAFRLKTSCPPTGPGWRIDAAATFRPWIFLHNLGSLAHEKLHIEDIRILAERYLALLEAEQFVSAEACQAAALSASTNFEATMRDFARRSNEERHPQLLRTARK